jgi:hypothetical protein
MNYDSRRIIAAGRRWFMLGIRQKLASTPTQGGGFMIRRSTRLTVSFMADMIPVSAPHTLALRQNGCSDIPTRRLQASLSPWRCRSGSLTRSR